MTRVLIVEDEESLADPLAYLLRKEGFEATVATDGPAALAEFGVPHVVLELNPETVRHERSLGHDIHYGDCTRAAVLEHVGIARARAYVLAISDAASTRRSVRIARELAAGLRIIVRTEYVLEVEELRTFASYWPIVFDSDSRNCVSSDPPP